MATVSDYAIASDDDATLQPGVQPTSRTFPFTVPQNVNASQSAVVTCMIEAEGPPQSLAWNLKINNTEVRRFTHSQDRFSAIQEVFPGPTLRAGANNATVTVTGGSGRLRISDIVIHFQVEVAS